MILFNFKLQYFILFLLYRRSDIKSSAMEAEVLIEDGRMVVHTKPKRIYVNTSSSETISPRKTRASEKALEMQATKKRIIFTQRGNDYFDVEHFHQPNTKGSGIDSLDDPAFLGSISGVYDNKTCGVDMEYIAESENKFDFDYFFQSSIPLSEACIESDSSLSDEELSLLLQC